MRDATLRNHRPMRNIIAIARKELGIYFTTPLPYALFAVATIAMGVFLVGVVQKFQEMTVLAMRMPQYFDITKVNLTELVVMPFLSQAGLLLVFISPFLSMRLIAEERRQRTIELLMTAPVRSVEIVLGKYLAGFLILAMAVALTFLSPVMLERFAVGSDGQSGIDWSTVRVAFLGLMLWAMAAMAVGLFVSALTDSQAVASIVTLLFLVLVWCCGWIGQGGEGVLSSALTYMGVPGHLDAFMNGLVRLEDITYFLSFVVLGLFLAHRAVEGHRWA